MMSSNLSGSRRLRESALRPSSAAPSQPSGAEVLSESEEEAEEDGLPSGASDAFQSSLDKLTEISIPADPGEDSKSKGLQGGPSLGLHIWWSSWRSQCRRRRLEASGCSSTCSSSSSTRSSRRHQLPPGAFDAGGLDQHCAASRSSTYHPVSKGVDRTQESHWLLSHCSLLCVVCRRNCRRLDPRTPNLHGRKQPY